MKALIVGHGFISSHLEERLKKEGEVMVISDKDVVNLENIEYLDIDYIFRLSAYGNHYYQNLYFFDKRRMIETNVLNLLQLLEFTKNINYKAFINFSTSSVTLPVQTMYSATKHAGEHICQAFAQKYKKLIISIRPYSLYGSREADFRFIPTIINNGLKGIRSKVVFESRHDWIFIEDFIDALMLITKKVEHCISYPLDPYCLGNNWNMEKPISIGTGLSWTNIEVVETINQIFADNENKELFYDKSISMREYDTKDWVADISTLKKLGWQPKHSLREGLTKVYAHLKQQFKKKDNRTL